MVQFHLICSYLIWFDQVWSIWSNSISFNPLWTNLNQFQPTWSNLIWFFPIWTNFIWSEFEFSKVSNKTKHDLKLKQALLKLKKCYFRCLLTFSFFGITGLLEDDAASRTSSCNLEYNTCTKLNQRVNIRWGSEIEKN